MCTASRAAYCPVFVIQGDDLGVPAAGADAFEPANGTNDGGDEQGIHETSCVKVRGKQSSGWKVI
ncbi:hypothetical protein DPF_1045 [Desulfoplanes formicivorans]|uniref:Uncharacterized protein n=1 Tax=Desulfoplanes formicivorans TaxID=1592317 RepID=A0A194AHT9_9BACT|nr:hypothetical protein DPF_1045 [Desulfoplanes formicivorans]